MDLDNNLTIINKELSSKGIKLRIEQRGERLSLRGPLPSKVNQGVLHVQRIPLQLKANPNVITFKLVPIYFTRLAELGAYKK